MSGLSSWLAQQALAPFTAADRQAAWRTLFDTLGVGIGAYAFEGAAIEAVSAQLCDGAPQGPVRVLRGAHRLPPAQAAAVMALACHSIDYDDTYMEGGVKTHVSAVVAPAAFAVAQALDSGVDALLDAICAGIEVETRLGHLVTPRMVRRWHPTGTLGPVGAAAAASRLLGLDASRTEQALGVAADAAAGSRVCLDQGDVTKSLHAAYAARTGVEAALLVQRGLTGPVGFFEARRGYLDTYVEQTADGWEAATGPAGARVHRNSMKLYPAMHALHAAIAALLELRPGDGQVPDAIVVTQSTTHAGFGRASDPRTPLAARLSLPYCAAVTWLDGACGFAQFGLDRLHDPALRALMARVTIEGSDTMEREYPDRIASSVEVHMPDGRSFSTFVADPPGCPDRPASSAQLRAKWEELLGARAERGSVDGWLAEFERRGVRSARELAERLPRHRDDLTPEMYR